MIESIRTFRGVVPWDSHVTVESNANLATLLELELVAVQLHGVSMGENEVVANAA
jgi:hypothetical protein